MISYLREMGVNIIESKTQKNLLTDWFDPPQKRIKQ